MENNLTDSQLDNIVDWVQDRIKALNEYRPDLSKEERNRFIIEIAKMKTAKKISGLEGIKHIKRELNNLYGEEEYETTKGIEHIRSELNKLNEQNRVEGEFELNKELYDN